MSRTQILIIAGLAVFTCPAALRTVAGPEGLSELSVCRRLQAATVRISSGADRSSGVVISSQGHVLTVAHGLHGDTDKVAIIFHDGAATEAVVLLKDSVADLAVLKIDVDDNVVRLAIPIAPAHVPTVRDVVLAAGFPGRERNGLSPVIRLGELLAVEPHGLRSSCTLTSGDSGGPLVNERGELIGLNRQIGIGTDSNLHVPIADLLTVALPVLDLTRIEQVPVPAADRVHSSESLVPSAAVLATCRSRTVELRYNAWDEVPVMLGTLLSESLVATKLSELSPNLPVQCKLATGRGVMASVIRSDAALDIAILKLAALQPNVSALTISEPIQDAGSSTCRFQLVFAAHNVSRAGIVSRDAHDEPALPCRFGAVLTAAIRSKSVIVSDVELGSSAAAANLVSGEVLQSLNEIEVTSLEQVETILHQNQPGDWLTIKSFRNPNQHSATVRLQHDPSVQFERTEFLDGRSGRVSERRSGFKAVLQHDIPISPKDCGGPLCNAMGQIIAMNIARRARESTLAVPIADVLKLANRVADTVDADDQ